MEYAIQIVFLQVAWMFKAFSAEDGSDEEKVNALKEWRDKALELYQEIALRDRSNALASVKQQVSFRGQVDVPAEDADNLGIHSALEPPYSFLDPLNFSCCKGCSACHA